MHEDTGLSISAPWHHQNDPAQHPKIDHYSSRAGTIYVTRYNRFQPVLRNLSPAV
jgi:hypothetical protein